MIVLFMVHSTVVLQSDIMVTSHGKQNPILIDTSGFPLMHEMCANDAQINRKKC